MPLQFGLNTQKSVPKPKSIWDDDDDDDEGNEEGQNSAQYDVAPLGGPSHAPKRFGLNAASKQPSAPPNALQRAKQKTERHNASSMAVAQAQVKAAEEIDPSIFDYDTFLDAKAQLNQAREAAARQEAVGRKPKYINNLLEAAARRKQDHLVAEEKLLQRQREEEGDEFADKEKFVTGAYKQQQEEARRLQQEEQARAEADEERQRRMGGGMQSFYRSVMDQTEKDHREALEAAANFDKEDSVTSDQAKANSDAELAAGMRAKGVSVHLNEDGQIIDKRELLTAGLNVTPSGSGRDGGADHLRMSSRTQSSALPKRNYAEERAQGERQRRMIDEQLEASAKRKREEEDAQRAQEERSAKSAKTEKDVSDAKARYLARKAAKESGKG